MLNFKIILDYITPLPRNGYARDRPGIFSCIFATATALPSPNDELAVGVLIHGGAPPA